MVVCTRSDRSWWSTSTGVVVLVEYASEVWIRWTIWSGTLSGGSIELAWNDWLWSFASAEISIFGPVGDAVVAWIGWTGSVAGTNYNVIAAKLN